MTSLPRKLILASALLCLASCSPSSQTAQSGRSVELDLTGKTKPKELGVGWSVPEGPYTWTDGHVAEVNLGAVTSPGAVLTVQAAGYGGPQDVQEVDVLANGSKIAHWRVRTAAPASYQASISPQVLQSAPALKVQFQIPQAQQPSPGARLLGLSVRRIMITPAPSTGG